MRSSVTRVSETAYPRREAGTQIGSAIVAVGRFCFSLIFIVGGLSNFTAKGIAQAASQGVPFASVVVLISGLLSLAGGLSILLGYHAKFGAWLLVLFLVPVTLMMHKFWAIADPSEAQVQMVMFMKNLSMLGGALIITQFGAGPVSFDARRSHGRTRPENRREQASTNEREDHR